MGGASSARAEGVVLQHAPGRTCYEGLEEFGLRIPPVADEIDLKRAEAARASAEALLAQGVEREERPGLEMALRRSQIRVKVASKRSGWRPASRRPRPGAFAN